MITSFMCVLYTHFIMTPNNARLDIIISGYGGSLGSSSASSLGEGSETNISR